MAESESDPRWGEGVHILLLVVGMTGTVVLFVWLGGGTITSVGCGMLVWCSGRWWDTRDDGRAGSAAARTRDDYLLFVVGLSLAACLFAASAFDGTAEDQVWATGVKTATALATATLAAIGAAHLRRGDTLR